MALINTTTTGIQGSTFYADGTGALTVQENGQTINKITKNPIFRATLSANQTGISHNTMTVVQFNTDSGSSQFDSDSCYDTSTYRFTPNVAGYYAVTLHIPYAVTTGRAYFMLASIWKNGSYYQRNDHSMDNTGSAALLSLYVNALIYFNGSTDYIDARTYHFDYSASSTVTIDADQNPAFHAYLVKAA